MERVATAKHTLLYNSPLVPNFIFKKVDNNNKINNIKNKGWSHIAPFSRLYLVKLKVIVQLKSQQ